MQNRVYIYIYIYIYIIYSLSHAKACSMLSWCIKIDGHASCGSQMFVCSFSWTVITMNASVHLVCFTHISNRQHSFWYVSIVPVNHSFCRYNIWNSEVSPVQTLTKCVAYQCENKIKRAVACRMATKPAKLDSSHGDSHGGHFRSSTIYTIYFPIKFLVMRIIREGRRWYLSSTDLPAL